MDDEEKREDEHGAASPDDALEEALEEEAETGDVMAGFDEFGGSDDVQEKTW